MTFIDQLLQDPSFLTGASLLGGQTRNIGANILGAQQSIAQLQAAKQQQQMQQMALERAQSQASFNPADYFNNGQLDNVGLLSGLAQHGYDPEKGAALISALSPKKELSIIPAGATALGPNGVVFTAPAKEPDQPSSIRELDVLQQRINQLDPSSQEYKNAVTLRDKMTGATSAAEAADRAAALAEQRKNNNLLREQNQQQQQDRFTQGQVAKLQDDLTREQIPQMTPVIKGIQDVLAKYPKGTIPGFGKGENFAANHGLSWMNSDEAQSVRQAIMPLANITIKVRSGAAVTQQEWDRFRQELGSGDFMSPQRIRQGLDMFQKIYGSTIKGVGAGYSNDVVNAYENRYPDIKFGRDKTVASPSGGGNDRAEAAKAELRRRGLLQ